MPEALVESAMLNVKILEDNNFFNFKISIKSSDVLSVKSYRLLANKCDITSFRITEAGSFLPGSMK